MIPIEKLKEVIEQLDKRFISAANKNKDVAMAYDYSISLLQKVVSESEESSGSSPIT